MAVVGATIVVLAGVVAVGARREPDAPEDGSPAVAAAGFAAPPATLAATAVPDDASAEVDLAMATGGDCTIEAKQLTFGDAGADVQCLQHGLVNAGYFDGTVDGQFDEATYAAVERLQEERALFVDGAVGRETALSVGIWPEEAELVIRTPPPADGAVDLMGYALSSVGSAGADAPPLPPDSGAGRRVVYERAGQRVWAVDEDEQIIRSWLVTGSKYGNEQPGFHEVYSRSETSTAWNGQAVLPLMIRWLKTDIGAIGFHAIPLKVSDGTPYQTDAELGTRLSGGCQRQANLDAAFMWDFAQVGTSVVVI